MKMEIGKIVRRILQAESILIGAGAGMGVDSGLP
ncbi:MAG: NAD-dependent deacetylase, partial [Opitutae bacterium]|nr:NAD-dependent deacetylase [Opitutae bacterium]